MNPVVDISCVHETVKSIYCSIHDALKILAMAYGECIARKRHECVSGKYRTPWISREHVFFLSVAQIKLLGRIFQTIEKRGPCSPGCQFGLKQL